MPQSNPPYFPEPRSYSAHTPRIYTGAVYQAGHKGSMPFRLNRWGGVHNEEVDRKAIMGLKILLLVAIPTVTASTVFACVYAWIQGRQYGYTVDDWQRCLVAPNKGGFGVGDQTLFTGSSATFAMKAIVFLILSFNGVNAGLIDHDMLPYGIFVSFSGLLGMTIYRESSPIQPEPRAMSVTLVTLTKFIHPNMYANLPVYQAQPDPSLCVHAYHFNVAFLVSQYIMLLLAVGLFSIAVYTLVYSPRDYLDTRLTGSRNAMMLVPAIMTGYLLTLLAKEIVAVDTIQVLQESELGYMFMFKKADMDVISMTMMVTCGAVLIGSFHECKNKFRLASFMAFLHVLISLPVMMGTFAAYDSLTFPYKGMTYRLWETTSCKTYINTKNLGIFGDSPGELNEICREVQLSLVGQTIILLAMFFQMLCCLRVVFTNEGPVRPPHETRCMSCAYRQESDGLLSFVRQPTILGSLSMYARPSLSCSPSHKASPFRLKPGEGEGERGMDRPLLAGWGSSSEESDEDTEEQARRRGGRRRRRRRRGERGGNGWRESGAVLTDDLAREVGYAEEEEEEERA